jgi:hypothetical protein
MFESGEYINGVTPANTIAMVVLYEATVTETPIAAARGAKAEF